MRLALLGNRPRDLKVKSGDVGGRAGGHPRRDMVIGIRYLELLRQTTAVIFQAEMYSEPPGWAGEIISAPSVPTISKANPAAAPEAAAARPCRRAVDARHDNHLSRCPNVQARVSRSRLRAEHLVRERQLPRDPRLRRRRCRHRSHSRSRRPHRSTGCRHPLTRQGRARASGRWLPSRLVIARRQPQRCSRSCWPSVRNGSGTGRLSSTPDGHAPAIRAI
jgi:hypothetical protein